MALAKKKNSPYWYAVIYVEPGKQKWFSTKTKNKRDAQKVYEKLKASVDEVRTKQRVTAFVNEMIGSVVKDSTIRVGTPFQYAWQQFKKHNTTKGEMVQRRKSVFDKLVEWISNSKYPVDTIEMITVQIAYEFMQDNYGHTAKGTYNRHISEIKGMWETLKMPLQLTENPWAEIPRRSDGAQRSWRNFSLEEVRKILAYYKENDIMWYRACLIAYYTGLRKIDVMTLRWSEIQETVNGKFIEKIPSKTQNQTKRVIRAYLHPDLVTMFDSTPRTGEMIFPEFCERMTTTKTSRNNFSKRFTATLKKLDITDRVSFHSWRHTFTTIALEHGVSMKVIGGIVGHTSPKVTERYDHDLVSGKQIQSLPSVLD